MARDKAGTLEEPAYVLHTYPFRDTSVIVEAFTRDHGRIGLVARGARAARSPLRSALLAFQPLHLAWSGKGELRTLVRAECSGVLKPLTGLAMMCGYYVNELLLKLLHRDDPHEDLYPAYESTLAALAERTDPALTLRRFEIALLREIGYALVLDREAEGDATLRPDGLYAYVPERGPVALVASEPGQNAVELRGKTLLDMARDDFSDPVTAAQSKALMRWLIGHHLDHRPLHTRQMLIELQQL